jgi:hypothetical protein
MRRFPVGTCLVLALALVAAGRWDAALPAADAPKKSDKVVVLVPLTGGVEQEQLAEDMKAGKCTDFEVVQRLKPVLDLKVTAVAEPKTLEVTRGSYLATQVQAQRDGKEEKINLFVSTPLKAGTRLDDFTYRGTVQAEFQSAVVGVGRVPLYVFEAAPPAAKRAEAPAAPDRPADPETTTLERPANPELLGGLNARDEAGRDRAVARLIAMGADGVPTLRDGLKSRDVEVRVKAAAALGKLGQAGKAAVPALVTALKDSSAAVRRQAAVSLAAIGLGARDAAPALTGLLRDSDREARALAAFALEKVRAGK